MSNSRYITISKGKEKLIWTFQRICSIFALEIIAESMSDGNFNRALLPSTPIASGIKMGKQQMKAKAVTVLKELMKEKFPTLSDEELQDIVKLFSSRL